MTMVGTCNTQYMQNVGSERTCGMCRHWTDASLELMGE